MTPAWDFAWDRRFAGTCPAEEFGRILLIGSGFTEAVPAEEFVKMLLIGTGFTETVPAKEFQRPLAAGLRPLKNERKGQT